MSRNLVTACPWPLSRFSMNSRPLEIFSRSSFFPRIFCDPKLVPSHCLTNLFKLQLLPPAELGDSDHVGQKHTLRLLNKGSPMALLLVACTSPKPGRLLANPPMNTYSVPQRSFGYRSSTDSEFSKVNPSGKSFSLSRRARKVKLGFSTAATHMWVYVWLSLSALVKKRCSSSERLSNPHCITKAKSYEYRKKPIPAKARTRISIPASIEATGANPVSALNFRP